MPNRQQLRPDQRVGRSELHLWQVRRIEDWRGQLIAADKLSAVGKTAVRVYGVT
jgi:hypothetical protein